MNPNLASYPYNRTYSILDTLGADPTVEQAQPLAMWIREQNGVRVFVDGSGCTLTTDFLRAVVMGVNWIRPDTPYSTQYHSHIVWRGLTQANRRALEQVTAEFPKQI